MTTKTTLNKELLGLVERFGQLAVEAELNRLSGKRKRADECTILVNRGLHSFPDHIYRGEVFVVYEGSLDLSSASALHTFVADRLAALRLFLLSKKWRQINVIISGHAAVCMQVKLAVYRVTHIETTDWVFDGEGDYIPLRIPLRKVLTGEYGA
jgi:hypothetical protein